MRTQKLYKVNLIGLQKEKEKILDFLHEQGILHLKQSTFTENKVKLRKDKPLEIIEEISSSLLEIKYLTEHLKEFKKSKSFSFRNRPLKTVLSEADDLKNKVYPKLKDNVEKKQKLLKIIGKIEEKQHLLEQIPFHFEKDTNLPFSGKDTCIYLFELLEETKPLIEILSEFECHLEEQSGFALIIFKKEQEEQILTILKGEGHKSISIELEYSSKQELRLTKEEIKEVNTLIKNLDSNLETLSHKHLRHAQQIYHELTIFHDRYEVTNKLQKTTETFILTGYVSTKEYKRLSTLENSCKVHIELEDALEAPSKLNNIMYVRRFEFITKMFGYPQYRSIDPTFYISLFLPFFFGFMFSDVGYGIMLLALSTFLYAKAQSNNKIMQDAGFVLGICSITTIIFGILFGSFFGTLFGFTPLLFDPFANAKGVLISALVIGIIHLNIGIMLSAIENIRLNKHKELVFGNGSIFSLQIGILLLTLQNIPAGIISLLVSAGLFIGNGGLMGLMDITGFIGTWFSYARLLALSLATGGIALGVNIMAEQLNSIAVLGPILFVILLVFGHLFNFVMNVLGSSIHSVRLHYIEFFSQFYEGGGEPFTPYTTKRIIETL